MYFLSDNIHQFTNQLAQMEIEMNLKDSEIQRKINMCSADYEGG